jgi:two-component sensor histidine kinase
MQIKTELTKLRIEMISMLIIFLFFTTPSHSQSVHANESIDSLLAVAGKENPEAALLLCAEAIQSAERNSYQKGKAIGYRLLAKLNINAADYYHAFLLLRTSSDIFQHVNDSAGARENESLLMLAFRQMGNRNHVNSYSQDFNRRLLEVSLLHTSDYQSYENIPDEIGLKKHRWQIFSIISLLFVLILLFGRYIDFANRRKQSLVTKLGSLESNALKAQMNPHFIFNSLNSIQALIANDNQSEAMLYVSKFSKLLRSVIENSNKNLIPLQNELNNLRFYIELESLRLNFSLVYSIDVDPEISIANEMIPPLILQPIVENALWHGLNGQHGTKELRVKIEADEKCLKFAVADNGIGRDAARKTSNKASTGVGLSNTERRITLLNDKIVKQSFWIEDLVSTEGMPLGTRVVFKIRRWL